MSLADAGQVTLTSAAASPPEFSCAEVWGGNRPINGPIELPGLRGWIYSHPCEGGRGGDIHYVSICGSGLLSRLCLADVAGHGEAIAAVSGEIHRLLRKYMNNIDQRRVLSDLNKKLEGSEFGTMTTAAALSYHPSVRALSVSYAGHPPAWLYRQRQDRWLRLRLETAAAEAGRFHDLPLAIDGQTSFTRRTQRVKPGDRLLAVTDGVLEAPGPDGELFGEARLEKLLQQQRQAPIKALAEAVVAAVVAHTRDERLPHDDVTLLLIEFVPGPRAFGMWRVIRNRLFPKRRSAHSVAGFRGETADFSTVGPAAARGPDG